MSRSLLPRGRRDRLDGYLGRGFESPLVLVHYSSRNHFSLCSLLGLRSRIYRVDPLSLIRHHPPEQRRHHADDLLPLAWPVPSFSRDPCALAEEALADASVALEEGLDAAVQAEAHHLGVAGAARADAVAALGVQRGEHVGLCEGLEGEEAFRREAEGVIEGGDRRACGLLGREGWWWAEEGSSGRGSGWLWELLEMQKGRSSRRVRIWLTLSRWRR